MKSLWILSEHRHLEVQKTLDTLTQTSGFDSRPPLFRFYVFPPEERDEKDRSPVDDSQQPLFLGVARLVVQPVHGIKC